LHQTLRFSKIAEHIYGTE